MTKPQIITPGNNRTYIPILFNPDGTNYGLDQRNPIPIGSVVLCGLPEEFDAKNVNPYDPKKISLIAAQTKISVLEKALEHFEKRGIDFLLVDPLTCQTIIKGKFLEDSSEELMEYVSQAFVRATPMVKRTE